MVSIKAGKLLHSTILRRLGSYSCHNRLYQAFWKLGLVVRTEFVLRYLSDLDLRRIIRVAMNKSVLNSGVLRLSDRSWLKAFLYVT